MTNKRIATHTIIISGDNTFAAQYFIFAKKNSVDRVVVFIFFFNVHSFYSMLALSKKTVLKAISLLINQQTQKVNAFLMQSEQNMSEKNIICLCMCFFDTGKCAL